MNPSETIIFDEPANDCKVWRYMKWGRLKEMIEENMIYFPRYDKLGDPFEGALLKSEEAASNKFIESYKADQAEAISVGKRIYHKTLRKAALASCWHMNDQESLAMWRFYGKDKKAIAIQTTYGNLKKIFCERSFRNCRNEVSCRFPKVRAKDGMGAPGQIGTTLCFSKIYYVNIAKEKSNLKNELEKLLRKDHSFNFEKELRIVFGLFPPGSGTQCDYGFNEKGYKISINPPSLIEKIYVSPITSNHDFQEMKRELSRLGGDDGWGNRIVKSELSYILPYL